jgi:hypothetical protein
LALPPRLSSGGAKLPWQWTTSVCTLFFHDICGFSTLRIWLSEAIKGQTYMLTNEPGLSLTGEGASQSDNLSQWEQYLHEQNLWDHFLSFTPEAIQWTYSVQR